MTEPSVDLLFDAAVRILLAERSITVSFTPGRDIRIKFPITRRVAEFLGLPHAVVLRGFAVLEDEGLVIKGERVGIVTTARGSRKMLDLMQENYRKESEIVLGAAVFKELYDKTR